MKNFFEGFKDLLYDYIDYIIVIGIIGIIALIIGWRIDLLFANDALGVIDAEKELVESNIDTTTNNKPTDNKPEDEELVKKQDKNTHVEVGKDSENNPKEKPKVVKDTEIIKLSIPAGSLPSKIATILEDEKLISSKEEFILKSQELNLDTKFKSGDFNIPSNSSLEDIIHLITK